MELTIVGGVIALIALIGLIAERRATRRQRQHAKAFTNAIERYQRDGWRGHDYQRDRSRPT